MGVIEVLMQYKLLPVLVAGIGAAMGLVLGQILLGRRNRYAFVSPVVVSVIEGEKLSLGELENTVVKELEKVFGEKPKPGVLLLIPHPMSPEIKAYVDTLNRVLGSYVEKLNDRLRRERIISTVKASIAIIIVIAIIVLLVVFIHG